MKTNTDILTAERREKLREFKSRLREVSAIEMSELLSEIDKHRAEVYSDEMREYALEIMENNEGHDCLDEIAEMYQTRDIDSVVISRESIFDKMIRDKELDIEIEATDFVKEINRELEEPVYCIVKNGNFKFINHSDRFESSEYDDVLKHSLTKKHKQSFSPFVTKTREVYDKQKSILENILNVGAKEKTLATLMNYKFLDTTLYDKVKRLYKKVVADSTEIVSPTKNTSAGNVASQEQDMVVADVIERNLAKRAQRGEKLSTNSQKP